MAKGAGMIVGRRERRRSWITCGMRLPERSVALGEHERSPGVSWSSQELRGKPDGAQQGSRADERSSATVCSGGE